MKELLRRLYSGAILVIWIILPYALLQAIEIREVWWLEQTLFDRWIGIHFNAVWVYFSFYFLLAFAGLAPERRVYLQYLYAVGWTTMAAHMIFLMIPSGLSRDAIEMQGAPQLYQWLVEYDKPRNVFPSLHVALSVLAGMALQRSCRFSSFVKVLVWAWVSGIVWSTVALGQHVIYDGILGALIAVVTWWVVGRYATSLHPE
ncbi:phosphatase PAP2 family protein [Rubritalea marina]|uniref:phosphatase PAP2 family protein n=1 Tax=Rubritalea marina TaxID=361055 RepID=UPI0014614A79|nr:phosphatase PAP2 family protein [Rubritalea marina]